MILMFLAKHDFEAKNMSIGTKVEADGQQVSAVPPPVIALFHILTLAFSADRDDQLQDPL